MKIRYLLTRVMFAVMPALLLLAQEVHVMAAGDVRAMEWGGYLLVWGDRQDNAFQVEQTGPTTYRITGLSRTPNPFRFRDYGPTTVNGQASVNIAGVDQGMWIDTGRGDNEVHVRLLDDLPLDQPHPLGFLEIDGDRGADWFFVQGRFEEGNLDIHTEEGDDRVILQGMTRQDELDINTGKGADEIYMLVCSADSAEIKTKSGDDAVDLWMVGFTDIEVDLGDDADDLFVYNSSFSWAVFDGGDGVNTYTEIAVRGNVMTFGF